MNIKYFLLWISLLLLLAALIVACRPYARNTFEEQFKKMLSIESNYGVYFSTERINTTNLTLQTIPGLIEDIEKLKESIKISMPDSVQKNASLLFMDARLLMLEAQKHFLLAKSNGEKGSALDGFVCGDYKEIFNASYHYNLSYVYIQDALFNLDEVLRQYNFTRPIVGIDENRPKFYFGPWNELKKLAKQRGTVERLCKDYIAEHENKTLV